MRPAPLILLSIGSPILLCTLFVGGRFAEWTFVIVSLIFPAALCALGVRRSARRDLLFPVLGLVLVLTGVGILLLDGRGGGPVLGLPPATALMLAGFGLVPLLLTGLGHAAGFRASPGDPPGEDDRDPRKPR